MTDPSDQNLSEGKAQNTHNRIRTSQPNHPGGCEQKAD